MRFSQVALSLLFFGSPGFAHGQSPETQFVRYSAVYVTTSTSGGQTKRTTGEEIRSEDGSLFTSVEMNGERLTARVWKACGELINLDYKKRQATIQVQAARKHPYPSPDSPLGSMTIAGVQAIGYPVHMSDGTGAIWLDVSEDIMLKLEIHYRPPGSPSFDEVQELTSVDFSTPIDPWIMQVPAGFKTTLPAGGVPATCVGK